MAIDETPEPEKKPEQPRPDRESSPVGRRPMPPESRRVPERPETGDGTEAQEPDSTGQKKDKGADSSTPDAVADDGSTERPKTGRERLVASLWPPRLTRAQLIVALLLFILGLGLAIQVRSTSDSSALRGARQEDLVRILDELDNRSQRLTDEQRRLEGQKTELENSSDQAEEARKQTVEKEQQLGVLAGTVAAQGPGINLTIDDPTHSVEADKLLDTIQELRAAGAEAIQVNDVRVVANTYLSDIRGGVEIDGKRVMQPYRFKVIGKPEDLEPALNIPGGVVQTLEKEQAKVSVTREEKIIVNALREAKRPDYARSSSQ
ncbi:DUF881 domain-containing protein [Streptomyces inhibens]|uniref:DUF881 domain-containing protein n=2 Tax=Streptomyces inhibens TaxID=2293571 RepID=A0A371PRA9_STRIH|nr:DUF881 domain-containing protein [Streptomyces inhibens]REK85030.1 DUF881 domain-containing protein [Streptomyces inhibens]